jgi:hypothetical protein
MRQAAVLDAAKWIMAVVGAFAASVALADGPLFPHWQNLDQFRERWYSEHLRAMNEGALSDSHVGLHIRFLMLPSFSHPVSVRIDCDKDCELVAYRLSGYGGYEPGAIDKRVARKLTSKEVQTFNRQLRAADLWHGQPKSDFGVDGSRWIVEAQRPEGYVAWDLWSPQGPPFQAFIDLCQLMMRLAALDSQPAP